MDPLGEDIRKELTVRLLRGPGGRLQVRHLLPRQREVARHVVEDAGLQGIRALDEALDQGAWVKLQQHLAGAAATNAGQMLWELLFGDGDGWQQVLGQVCGAEVRNPTRHAVRLRIWTEDPLLLAVPWRLLAFQGKALLDHGWTMEAVQDERCEGVLHLSPPLPILVLAPEYPGWPDIGSAVHVDALKDVLERLSPRCVHPDYFQAVRDREALATALAGMRPTFLYYYGHGEALKDQLCLRLGVKELLPMADLKRMMNGAYPKVAFLNGCMTGATGWHSAGHQLGPDVKVVITNRTTAW